MDNFDIEIMETNETEQDVVQLPLNFLTIGEIENDDIKVYIKQDVYKALEEYAASDTDHELGTILIGKATEQLNKTYVIVSDYILAKYTDASASTLTFTHQTWDYVHREYDEKYSDKKIIGWQHTHPGYGIFLSNYDMFIQENFFNVPFQIAYVIDPVQHLRGFFQWKNGKVEKLNGFYVYDELGKTIKIEQPKANKGEKVIPASSSGRSTIHIAVTSILAILTCVLLMSTISLSRLCKEQADSQQTLQSQISAQNDILDSQADDITELRGSVEQLQHELTEDYSVKEDTSEYDAKPNIEFPQLNQEEDSTDTGKVTCFEPYIVQSGDTLVSICNQAGVDYNSTYRIILSVNGITNANEIYVGQTVLLPINQ